MALVFLDTSTFIDLLEHRPSLRSKDLINHHPFASPLSFHIAAYSYKYKIPNSKLTEISNQISLVSFDDLTLNQALAGPTVDLEDNIQLHSAANANCDIFLTRDEKLAKLIFFGRTKITTHLS